MSRKIIFRAKSKTTNTWLYGDLLRNEQGTFAVVPPFKMSMSNECNLYEVDEETVGQFTGLYDKVQKPIYEGDIVLQQGCHGKKIPMVVRFECGAFIVGYHEGSSTKRRPMLLNGQCEIIGTIYDNANLLEDDK